MFNEEFFIFISFVIFVMLVFKPVKASITTIVNQYSEGVMKSIDDAKKMQMDAEKELLEIKDKSAQIHFEVEKIMREAREESESIINEAKASAAHLLEKRNKLAMERISLFEAQIAKSIKEELVSIIINNIDQKLSSKLNKEAKNKMLEASLAQAKKIIH